MIRGQSILTADTTAAKETSFVKFVAPARKIPDVYELPAPRNISAQPA